MQPDLDALKDAAFLLGTFRSQEFLALATTPQGGSTLMRDPLMPEPDGNS